MKLTKTEIEALERNESLFNTDLNLGLVGVAEFLSSQVHIIGKAGVLRSIGSILNFLAEDTDLLNDIDDRLYDYLANKLGAKNACFGIYSGNTEVLNSKLTVGYLIYEYDIRNLSLPNVKKATPGVFLIGSEAHSLIENVYLPELKDFGPSFILLENCNIKTYYSVEVNASAALLNRMHNTNPNIKVTEA